MMLARAAHDVDAIGQELHDVVRELFPICRSITGNGVRRTLHILGRDLPLQVHEVPSGTPVLDWTVPLEWNISDAWIKNAAGERVVDFRQHNLHVVSYSRPIRRRVSRAELLTHLHTLPDRPNVIPYRTTYYSDAWGFCVPHRLVATLTEPEYDVCIDSTLEPGTLTYGEIELRGAADDEILISCHVCHPSLADDNLSSLAVAARLARQLQQSPRRYSYRFLFVPGTIGAITWLAQNEARIGSIRAGLVLTCLGDGGAFTYKRSNRGDTEIDRLVAHVFTHADAPSEIRDFSPYGYDERQYCSPGFDLAVGRLSRSVHGEFPEYHTSADNLEFVTPAALAQSYGLLSTIIETLEGDATYINRYPKGEPQLGRRGLYGAIGGTERASREMAMLWVLNQSNGRRTLLDIAGRAGMPFAAIRDAALLLETHGLLERCAA